MENNSCYKYYTLEKHLKLLSEQDKDYEVLYSIWMLNKQNLSQGLSLISNTYPHYSKHDISHSMTIVDNIQRLLGEERIKQLGATDTFLILMACLTHDIGMILTHKLVEEEWSKKSFKDILTKLSNYKDSVISEYANLLLNNDNSRNIDCDNYKWAINIKNAVIVLTAEIFRDKHAQQSANNILSNEEFKNLANNYYSEQLPNRFVELLADIALLHGEAFENVISHLHHKANGYKSDYIHPRFIACMIRLGDLLDFDSNRFNAFSIATIEKIPDTSISHQQKHAAVRHMLISPTSIEAELNCNDEEVYRIARSWFDWLENEVNNQSREWSNIVPSDLGGLPPIISKDSIKILYKGIQVSPTLLNLKFTMSSKKMFDILQGGGIYKEPGFAFIREIVQNAFDASKIQMWNDINAGIYDSYFEDKNITIDTISFPDDISPIIYRQYPIDLTVDWLNDNKDIIHIECKDRGTGISEATLLRMTNNVGESYMADHRCEDNYQNMPCWLKPTAAFGIGLQSIFFVAKTFEVETAFPNEKTKCIIFRSAADNQYCSIITENFPMKRGTTIKIDIPKAKFPELFGTSFSWDLLGTVDIFKGNGDDLYLAKMDEFVSRTFGHVQNICFNYNPINPERGFKKDILFNRTQTGLISGNYKYSYEHIEGFLLFSLFDKKSGSSLSIWFNNDMKLNRLPQRLLLRDVMVSNASFGYLKTGYLGFEWNLNNQASDTIVDLSRDNLTYRGKQWVKDTLLKTLLPEILDLISGIFIKELDVNRNNTKALDIQYLNYCLTAFAYNKNTYDIHKLDNIKLPHEITSRNGDEITADVFFNASTLFLVYSTKTNGYGDIIQEEINRIEKEYNNVLADKVVLWGDNYLHNALMFNYICTEVVSYESDCKIYRLDRVEHDVNDCIPIKFDEKYLCELGNLNFLKCSRNAVYGLDKYQNICVKNYWISGFEHFPSYSSCCIYSPFTSREMIKNLLESTKIYSCDNDIRQHITSNVSEYLTPYLIKIIKQYSINQDVSEEQIKNDYVSLIFDYVKCKTDNEMK